MGERRIEQTFIDKFDVSEKTQIIVVDHVTNLGHAEDEPVLIFKTIEQENQVSPWLTRGQVQDLMIVLGYWLKQTEGEDDDD